MEPTPQGEDAVTESLKVFEVLRKGGAPSAPIPKRDAANLTLVDRVTRAGRGLPYEFKRRGTELWTPARGAVHLREGLEQIRLRTGEAIYARRAGRSAIFVLRAVELVLDKTAPCPDPSATRGVVQIWGAIQEETQLLELQLGRELTFVQQGIFNCRKIDGSTSWSQHAFHNALDGHIASEGKPLDVEATTKLVERMRARGICAEILWQVAAHFGHFHLTASPKLGGLPACA
jgi:hypothetical protein